jgi:hypothetical protein
MISVKNNYETDITKKTAARQDFMPWLALLQTAIKEDSREVTANEGHA